MHRTKNRMQQCGLVLPRVLAVVLVAASMVACNSTNGTLVGAGIGTTIGTFAGKKLGGDTGMIIGAGLGAIAGGAIGGEIGRALDEQDRRLAAQTTAAAISQSQASKGESVTVSWVSDTNKGVSGSARATASSANCYSVQEVAVVPGTGDVRQQTEYCEKDGQWLPV